MNNQKYFKANISQSLTPTLLIPFLWIIINNTKGILFWKNTLLDVDFDLKQSYYDGSPFDRVIMSILLIIGLSILFHRRFKLMELARKNVWLLVLLFYMLISIIWGEYQFIALKRWIKTFGTIVMVAIIATERLPFKAGILTVELLSAFVLIISLILIIVFPNIGIMYLQSVGNCWTGLTSHKNQLGQWASIGAIIFFWQYWNCHGAFRKSVCLSLSGLSFILLIGSKSETATLLTLFGIVLMVCLVVIRKIGKGSSLFALIALITLVASILLYSQFFLNGSLLNKFFNAIGKDSSFTGRTDIWGIALQTAGKKMLLGYGYGTFWMTNSADKIRQICEWDFFSAHNGFLDIYLHLGLLGLVLSMFYIFSAFIGIISIYRRDYKNGILWVIFICVTLLSNLFESNFGIMAHEFWFLSILVCFRMPEKSLTYRY